MILPSDCAVALFEAEDVYVEDSVAEEGDGLFHLRVVVVELRHDGVGSEPAVGGELAVFGSVVGGVAPRASRGMWQVWQVETESLT